MQKASKGWWALRAFQDWADQQNKRCKEVCPRDLLDKLYSPEEIWDCLQRFVPGARRGYGTPYPARTFYQILCGLPWHSREIQPKSPNFLDWSDALPEALEARKQILEHHRTCSSNEHWLLMCTFSNWFTSLDIRGEISYCRVITKISPSDNSHSIHYIPLIHPHTGIEIYIHIIMYNYIYISAVRLPYISNCRNKYGCRSQAIWIFATESFKWPVTGTNSNHSYNMDQYQCHVTRIRVKVLQPTS